MSSLNLGASADMWYILLLYFGLSMPIRMHDLEWDSCPGLFRSATSCAGDNVSKIFVREIRFEEASIEPRDR